MEIDRLLNLNYDLFSENEKYVCHYLSGHLRECKMAILRDAVILISLSGESQEVVSLARELRMRHVPAVSITRMKSNTLASLCEEKKKTAFTFSHSQERSMQTLVFYV